MMLKNCFPKFNHILRSKISSSFSSKNTSTSKKYETYVHYFFGVFFTNVVYALSRSKNDRNTIIRNVSFFFGLPLSVLSYLIIAEGSYKLYGLDISRLK